MRLKSILMFFRYLVWAAVGDPCKLKFIRRMWGGHWELWWVDMTASAIWFDGPALEYHPHFEHGPLRVEDYGHAA